MKHLVRRWIRRCLLSYAKGMNPEKLRAGSERRALEIASLAANNSEAYRTLLAEQRISPASIGTTVRLADLPVLSKSSTFGRFPLHQLARRVETHDIADVLTSSGRGGSSFGYKLSLRAQHDSSWFDIDLGLQDMFDIDSLPTLIVNCLPMGVIFHSKATAIANLSVREDMACSILRDIGPRFRQTLLCTDPMFIRRILDEANRVGVDWSAINTSVILGEEMLTEAQRDFFAAEMHINLDETSHRTVGSTYGMGELGLNLLFETRETIRMRRHLWRQQGPLGDSPLADRATPGLFCFNPLRCHPEVLTPAVDGFGELAFTLLDRSAVIPLPRYCSGDAARLLSAEEVREMAAAAGTSPPWLPMIAVRGRLKDRPAGQPSVESIKDWLYADHTIARQLTGAFRLHRTEAGSLTVTVQASQWASSSLKNLGEQLSELLSPSDRSTLNVTVVSANDFEWRPTLDFERKFPYVQT